MKRLQIETEDELVQVIESLRRPSLRLSNKSPGQRITLISGVIGSGKKALLNRICARLGLIDAAYQSPIEIRDCLSGQKACALAESGVPVYTTIHATTNIKALERLYDLCISSCDGKRCDHEPLDMQINVVKSGSVLVNVSVINTIGAEFYTWNEYQELHSLSLENQKLKQRILKAAGFRNAEAIRFRKKSREQLSHKKLVELMPMDFITSHQDGLEWLDYLLPGPAKKNELMWTFEVDIFDEIDAEDAELHYMVNELLELYESHNSTSHRQKALEAMFSGRVDPKDFELKFGPLG
jgi:hypothetical protein